MPEQDQHASSVDLFLYSEGSLTNEAAAVIANHLDNCPECYLTVLVHHELQALDSLGVLPAAAPVSIPQSSAPKNPQSERSKGSKIFGAFGILAGLGLTGSLTHHPVPSLGENLDDHQPDDVRNDPYHSSHNSEGHPSERGEKMAHPADGYGEATHTFGAPASDSTSDYVHQTYADTCAVQCQHLILDSFGIHVTEDNLVKEAEAKGIYSPGHGTQLDDVGKLLESHGVTVHREMNANVFNLANELAQGHQVIVGLDSGELWQQNSVLQSIADAMGIGHADHAVIVSGIDTTDPNHVNVIVTDPGTGDVAKEYPLSEFLDAWRTSHFSMVATSEPTPSWHPEMVNFDYHTGHLPEVGAAPYDFVHELSGATGHETDPSLIGELGSFFMSVVDGHTSMNDAFHGISHSSGLDHHGNMHGLVSDLLSLGHAGMLTGAIAALLETAEMHPTPSEESASPSYGHEHHVEFSHDDTMPHHDNFGHDYNAHPHEAFHSDSDHTNHHFDDSGDPQDGSQ